MSDVFTPLAIKTITAGGVSGQIDQTTPGTTNGVQINAPLPAGSNLFGHVIVDSGSLTLGAGTASLGTVGLNAGSASFGTVGLNAGSASIGSVGLNAGTNVIGHVVVDSIAAGTNSLGTVGLNAGTHLIGKLGIDQTTPGSSNGVQLTGPGTSSLNPVYINTGDGTSGTIVNSGSLQTVDADNSGPLDVGPNAGLPVLPPFITVGKVGSLQHVVMSASVPGQWSLGYFTPEREFITVYIYYTSAANLNAEFNAKLGAELKTAAGDGTNVAFAVSFYNSDNVTSAAGYATFTWIEN